MIALGEYISDADVRSPDEPPDHGDDRHAARFTVPARWGPELGQVYRDWIDRADGLDALPHDPPSDELRAFRADLQAAIDAAQVADEVLDDFLYALIRHRIGSQVLDADEFADVRTGQWLADLYLDAGWRCLACGTVPVAVDRAPPDFDGSGYVALYLRFGCVVGLHAVRLFVPASEAALLGDFESWAARNPGRHFRNFGLDRELRAAGITLSERHGPTVRRYGGARRAADRDPGAPSGKALELVGVLAERFGGGGATSTAWRQATIDLVPSERTFHYFVRQAIDAGLVRRDREPAPGESRRGVLYLPAIPLTAMGAIQ